MNATERRYPAQQPSAFAYIDLPSLRSSLTPSGPRPAPFAGRSPAQQAGDEFTEGATRIFAVFLVLMIAVIAGYIAAQ